MNRVAFTLPDVGLREVRGTVCIEDGFLVLNVQDAVVGLLDERKLVIKVEPQALEDVYIKRGAMKDRLVIKPKRADLLEAVPGEHASAVELRVKRRDRRELELLVDEFDALLEA